VDEAADRDWFIAAAFRVEAAAHDLLRRVRLYYAELLRLNNPDLLEQERFSVEYFRQRMAEARRRRREERARRIAEMLANRSGNLLIDEPIELDAVPGLTEALNGLVSLPVPVDVLRAFMGRSDFDLDGYQRHVIAHLGLFRTDFEAIPALIEDQRKDRIFRFIAVIFLAHARHIELWQEDDRIWMRRYETDEQGQGIRGRIEEAA
jgi:hypothetical protein